MELDWLDIHAEKIDSWNNIKKYTDDMKIDTEVGKGTAITMVINI